MALTIIVGGPAAFEGQVRASLEAEGLAVHDTCAAHGMADLVDGGKDVTAGFVSCEGDDVDAAVKAVEPLGWALREHRAPSLVTAPLLEDVQHDADERLRQIVREELEAMKAGN